MTIDTDRVRGKWIYHSCKRAFDFCVSALALIILSPLFLIIAVAIKLDDPDGGVFYSQVRIGKDGRKFRMFKFRSMITNADQKLKDLLQYISEANLWVDFVILLKTFRIIISPNDAY